MRSAKIDGLVAAGFEEVRQEFERNFAERGEIGAALAAYWRGEKVVDLWGGRRAPDGRCKWERGNHGHREFHHQGTRGDDPGGGQRARMARLRRARRAVLARVRAERQERGHRAPAPRPSGRARPARRGTDDREAARPRLRRAPARAAEAGVAARDAPRLSRDDARDVHAGADPSRRSGAQDARPLLS